MTTQKLVLAGFSLIAGAIILAGLAPHLRAAIPAPAVVGTWQIFAVPESIAWKLNTVTGELFYCSGIFCEPARATSD